MASFDDFARLCADELRTAANLDRAANRSDDSFPDVTGTNVVAALRSIGQLLGEMRDVEKKRIMELTAQRLGLDPEKLRNSLHAVGSKNALLAIQEIRHIIDEAT